MTSILAVRNACPGESRRASHQVSTPLLDNHREAGMSAIRSPMCFRMELAQGVRIHRRARLAARPRPDCVLHHLVRVCLFSLSHFAEKGLEKLKAWSLSFRRGKKACPRHGRRWCRRTVVRALRRNAARLRPMVRVAFTSSVSPCDDASFATMIPASTLGLRKCEGWAIPSRSR